MSGRLGPRFALEAAFLILLAVALGIADLSVSAIVAVMAAGWLLVSLIELVASREPRFPPRSERVVVEEAPVAAEPAVAPIAPEASAEADAAVVVAEDEEEVESSVAVAEPRRRRWFRRRATAAPSYEPEPVEAEPVEPEPVESEPLEPEPVEPMGAPSAVEAQRPAEEAAEVADRAGDDEADGEADAGVQEAEPPRRRWFRRRKASVEPEAAALGEVSLPPRHVRRIEPDEDSEDASGAGASVAAGDEHDSAELAAERERQTG